MAAPPANDNPPSTYSLQHSSPLDSLARQTSARHAKSQPRYPAQELAAPFSNSQPVYDHSQYALDPNGTPPKQSYQRHPPSSPLLHSHFARDSTATASSNDNNSYLDRTADSKSVYRDLEYHYYDDESIYSEGPPSPALRDSWQSTATYRAGNMADLGESPYIASNITHQPPPSSPVPAVIVSSPDPDPQTEEVPRAGRAPIVRTITSNFSRPVRAPQAPSDADEQKRRVLERNTKRTPSPNPLHSSTFQAQQLSHPPTQGQGQQSNVYLRGSLPASTSVTDRSRSPTSTIRNVHSGAISPSPQTTTSPSASYYNHHSPHNTQTSMTPAHHLMPKSPNTIALPRHPPSPRADSPASLYSAYSYYQYDSAAPSPTNGSFRPPLGGPASLEPSRNQLPPANPVTPLQPALNSTPQTPQEYLQLGIQHHEANRLKESAECFEKSAKERGGCGVGMLMWGLTLRHGWGCEKNEKLGFNWLRRAAENAVGDLEGARGGVGMDRNAVQVCISYRYDDVGRILTA